MESSAVRIVRIDGMLIIGVAGGNSLLDPRVIQVSQGPNNQVGVALLQLIGYPKSIELHEPAFSYECQDENIVTAYRENVTGLTLAKSMPAGNAGNVVKLRMTRQ